ncbi:MAG: hypothetical protein ACI8Q1_003110 [Parvicella sp.]|jgi:hypothetical protein
MAESDITVSNASVGGDFTGRDKIEDKSLTINTSYGRSVYLEDLYNKFDKEKNSNPGLQELCEQLDYFNSKIEGEEIEGLEAKLTAGNRQKLIRYATRCKEKFHMKLMKTSQYSQVAQDINVHILTKVERSFVMHIYTLICNDESEEKINTLIDEKIIKPVMSDLGINLFKYDEADVMGMIYFLTGNCHIKWTA